MSDEELIAMVLIVVALCATITKLGTAWMQRSTTLRAAAPSPEQEARLMRIEHAVDAIAVEVERVSESQRFATRLLHERADAVPSIVSDREVTHAR
jgi:hypothetical protein